MLCDDNGRKAVTAQIIRFQYYTCKHISFVIRHISNHISHVLNNGASCGTLVIAKAMRPIYVRFTEGHNSQ